METKLMLGSNYDPAGSEPSQAYPIQGRVSKFDTLSKLPQ